MTLDLAIPDLAAAHGRFLDALRREGEIALRSVAAESLPDLVKAVGPETEGQGKAAIIADIFKVVVPVSPQNERRVEIHPSPMRSLMPRYRRSGKVESRLVGRHRVRLADFLAYRDEKFKHVGMASAGYLAAARELGVDLPAWIAEHTDSDGSISVERDAGGVWLTLTNAVPWAAGLPETMSRSGYAVQRRAGRLYVASVEAWDRAKLSI